MLDVLSLNDEPDEKGEQRKRLEIMVTLGEGIVALFL